MKNNYLKIAFSLAIIVLITSIIACDKKLNLEDPNVKTPENFYKTSAELQSGTNAIYSTIKGSSLVAREWFFVHDTRSDEVSTGGGQLEAERAQMLNGGTVPSNPLVSRTWSALYVMIHRANVVIANGPFANDNPSLTAQSVAEAKFLRAWAYNELVSMWGPVPLVVKPTSGFTDYQPRAKESDIYAQIITDLNEAAAVLPGKSAYASSDKSRATNAAANFLLGRVHMQNGNYPLAKAALLKIPTTGANGYKLTNRYLDNFEEETEFNEESIFEIVFFDKGNNDFNWNSGIGDGNNPNVSTVRNQEYNGVAWRNLIPSNKFLANFENTSQGSPANDPRLGYTVYQTGDLINNGTETLTDAMQNGFSSVLNGVTKKISWRKYNLTYKENSGFHPGGNNQRLFRYAEVLLNLAECEAEAGNFSTTDGAGFYLNLLRARPSVSMPAYPTAQYLLNDKANTIKTIIHEKMAEMGCEEVRNIDIIRWRKKGYFSVDPLPYFKANRDELLPIPQQEIDNNPKLDAAGIPSQNVGYVR
jgi:starch-binding outer membrane protein, SusD/RagB family